MGSQHRYHKKLNKYSDYNKTAGHSGQTDFLGGTFLIRDSIDNVSRIKLLEERRLGVIAEHCQENSHAIPCRPFTL